MEFCKRNVIALPKTIDPDYIFGEVAVSTSRPLKRDSADRFSPVLPLVLSGLLSGVATLRPKPLHHENGDDYTRREATGPLRLRHKIYPSFGIPPLAVSPAPQPRSGPDEMTFLTK